jgi:hypothetical protein
MENAQIQDIVKTKLENNDKMTFDELLKTLNRADDELLQFDWADQRLLKENIELKVDGCKYYIDKLKTQIDLIDTYIKEYQQTKRTLQNNLQGFKDFLSFQMKNQGFDKLPGKRWRVSLSQRKSIKIKAEANSGLFLRYPDLIKREFSWRKKDVDAAIKSGKDLSDVADIETKEYPLFRPNKELQK